MPLTSVRVRGYTPDRGVTILARTGDLPRAQDLSLTPSCARGACAVHPYGNWGSMRKSTVDAVGTNRTGGRLRSLAIVALTALVATTFMVRAAGSDAGHGGRQLVRRDDQPDRVRELRSRAPIPKSGTSTVRVTPAIQGFATDISVNVGQKIDFKIDTKARAYTHRHLPHRLVPGSRRAEDRVGVALGDAAADPAPVHLRCHDRALRLRHLGGLRVVERAGGCRLGRLHREADPHRHGRRQPHHLHRPQRRQPLRRRSSRRRTRRGRRTTRTAGRTSTRAPRNGRAYKISYNRPFATRGTDEARELLLQRRVSRRSGSSSATATT